ncbi:alpha/beta fold hydrolase [Kitasatospora sp. MBT63]|uniref:alpha/beta fold hydrolase n=1 Tax=Kitasatospora sp. MBT63 TaxID=1444768 RepID=UPI00053B54EB|nr:alpha/beta hydrolase [Kitasatospora sp. MBT63]
MNTTVTQYVTVPGGRIAFDDSAAGPTTGTTAGTAAGSVPVVLLPGMLDRRTTYRHLVPLLTAAGHRVITMDLRGLGDSSTGFTDHSPAAIATDVVALLDHLGIGRAVLAGNSYTGATVVKVAGDRPELVAGIVLIDAFIENLPPNAFQKALVKTLGAALVHFPALWGAAQKLYFPTERPADFDAYRAGLVAMLREPGRKAATRGYVSGDSAPVGWTAAVTCPALVLMGTKDVDFPDPELVADRQAAALKGRKVMIDGGGHYPMAGFPQATADALLPFLHEVA